MKIWIVGLLMLSITNATEAKELHRFKNQQGQSIIGRVLEADLSKGKVRIESVDGRKTWVDPSIFCESDQEYIHNWMKAWPVISEQLLTVSADAELEEGNGQIVPYFVQHNMKYQDSNWCQEEHHAALYRITFNNRGHAETPEFNVECRCYIRVAGKGGRDDLLRMNTKTFTVDSIAEEKQSDHTTGKFSLYEWLIKQTVSSYSYGQLMNTQKVEKVFYVEELEGIWLKISVPLDDGESLEREVCFPENLQEKVYWDETDTLPWDAAEKEVEVTSLARIKARGKASSRMQHYEWLTLARHEIEAAGNDAALLKEISDGIDYFFDPELAGNSTGSAMWSIGYLFEKAEAYDLALHWYELGMKEVDPHESSGFLVRFIKMAASSPHEQLRDGKLAVQYALQALDTDKKSDKMLELMARAYARNGQFDLAVKFQQQAIARLKKSRKDEKDLQAYEERLALYQHEQPFTEKSK